MSTYWVVSIEDEPTKQLKVVQNSDGFAKLERNQSFVSDVEPVSQKMNVIPRDVSLKNRMETRSKDKLLFNYVFY